MGDNRGHYRVPGNFEEIFQKLVQYKEEHGDCLVSKNYMVDQQVSSCTALTNTVFLHGILCSIFLFICIDTHAHKLANWVRGIREKKAHMIKKGIDVEEVQLGKSILAKTLTAERIDKLNSIGFVWSVAGPKMLWEDRFRDCIEYYEMNGRWPSQSMGSLGEWVHKQRTLYTRKDVNYMKNKAPKVRENNESVDFLCPCILLGVSHTYFLLALL